MISQCNVEVVKGGAHGGTGDKANGGEDDYSVGTNANGGGGVTTTISEVVNDDAQQVRLADSNDQLLEEKGKDDGHKPTHKGAIQGATEMSRLWASP